MGKRWLVLKLVYARKKASDCEGGGGTPFLLRSEGGGWKNWI